jgi:para-aminobenzoate synthetase component I
VVLRDPCGRIDHNGHVETSFAYMGGLWAHELVERSSDPRVLSDGNKWVVVMPYDQPPTFLRFAHWDAIQPVTPPWQASDVGEWGSSLDRPEYLFVVDSIKAAIAAGSVYQANMCRVMSAPTTNQPEAMADLMVRLQRGNPAPFHSCVVAPGIALASASPELFIRREGSHVVSSPIKGTARTPEGLLPKDRAENTMIVDLVRNDLSRISQVGSVQVPTFLGVEHHPSLVHLVSSVSGELRAGIDWPEIFGAMFPAGSITGAPKRAAMGLIEQLESVPRELYCGAVGWIHKDRAELAVAIRTFWMSDGWVKFGTGAGITWSSDPQGEWDETELKAARLIAVAST